MSRDPSGFYTIPPLGGLNPVVGGTPILTTWANPTLGDIAAALSDSLSRSGKGGMNAPLVMNGYKVTSIGPATLANDAVSGQQVRDSQMTGFVSGGMSDASGNNYIGTAILQIPPNNGTRYTFLADKTNTGPMTLAVNGGAALPILIRGAPVPSAFVVVGTILEVIFNNLTWLIVGLAPGSGTVSSVQSSDPSLISVVNSAGVATLTPHANVALGMVKLDGSTKVPVAQLPFQDLFYVGIWDASGGTLPSTTGINNGDFFIITVAGTLTIFRVTAGNVYTAQSTAVVVGDAIILRKGATDPNQPDGWYFDPAAARPAVAGTVSMTATSANAPFAGITNLQAWLNVADPAILGRLPLAGGTMSGPIVQPAAPSAGTELANKTYVDGRVASAGGVTSFNARTGAVSLTSPDVTGALGYTPVNPASANFTAHVTGTTAAFSGGVRSLYYVPVLFASTIGGTTTISMFNGQVQNLGLVANLILTAVTDMVDGAIMRLVFNATDLWTITWPANVYWPLGVAPDLAAGPNHVAVVVLFQASSTTILASATMY